MDETQENPAMTTDTTPPRPLKRLLKAMHNVMTQVAPIIKSSLNTETGSYYATLDQVQEALHPSLLKEGLMILPEFKILNDRTLETTLMAVHITSQESLRFTLPVPIAGTAPTAVGAAVTYSRRVLLCSMFNMRTPEGQERFTTNPAEEATGQRQEGDASSTGTRGVTVAMPAGATADERRDAIAASRNLSIAWSQATRALGRPAVERLLQDAFGVIETRLLPTERIVEATAHLNLAVHRAQPTAPVSDDGASPDRAPGAGIVPAHLGAGTELPSAPPPARPAA
jgi:hypothetical protein